MHDDTRVASNDAGAGVSPDGSALRTRAYASAAWLVAIVSVATMISHGWVPLDEATTLLAARWVDAGAMPHRDFAYPYTGGLAALHALAVGLAGDSMLAPRLSLLAAFALWLPAVWTLARRFAAPPTAALTVVACAWWSLLVYPAAMPTWYVLFCSTWAVIALARWHDTGTLRWVVLAGLAAGVAVAIKQTGLATLVGAGFGVLAIHQQRESDSAQAAGQTGRNLLVLALLTVAAIVPLAIATKRGLLSGESLAIALPLAAVIFALARREWHATFGANDAGPATRRLLTAWGALTAGALVPVLALIGWYAMNGAADALVAANTGGLVRTASTIDQPMVSARTMLAYGLAGWAVIGGAAVASSRIRTASAAGLFGAAIAMVVLVAAAKFTPAYRALWLGAQLVLPAALILIVRGRNASASDPMPLVLAAAAALLAVNQVPYGAPNYFAYVAPLAILAGVAATSAVVLSRALFIALLVLTAFAGWFHRIGSVHTVGFGPVWWDDAHALPGAYGKLLVTAPESTEYARLTQLVVEHGGSEQFAAGPELGVLYALAGTRRVVAQPYLLTDDPAGDSTAVAAVIDSSAIVAVALNNNPRFLPTVSASAREWIVARFPNVERVGNVEFRWR